MVLRKKQAYVYSKNRGSPMKNERFIDTITLSTGEVVELVMPTMGDIYPYLISGPRTWLEVVIPAATQRNWEWFLKLSLFDGSLILHKLAPAFKAMHLTVESMSVPETRH